MTSILFIEAGTYGGGSFESLYLNLKYINRELYRPIVVLFNRTKYDNLFASINVDVHHIDDPVYSIELSSFPIKVIRKICSKAYRFNIRILIYVLRICHLKTIRIIKKIIKAKDISLIHMNDQILRDLFCVLISSDTKLPCVSHLRSMRSNGFTKQIADYANSKVTVYVANSESTKNHWKNLGLDEKKIEVIHNAIELRDVNEVRDNSKYSELTETKFGQKLINKYLKLYDFGGVFNDPNLPLEFSYYPKWNKLLNPFFYSIGKMNKQSPDYYNHKYMRYFLTYAPYYPQSNYLRYLKDSEWHRNPVSYWVKSYLSELDIHSQ